MGSDGPVRPLYYIGTPTEQQRLALRRGKDLLGVDFLVQPTPAKPGCDAALAFSEPEFYVHTYANLTPPYTPTRMASALSEVLGLKPPDHLTTGAQWLSQHMGMGVVYVGEEAC
jgi:hypothetical protein